jgi:hypothetical protein
LKKNRFDDIFVGAEVKLNKPDDFDRLGGSDPKSVKTLGSSAARLVSNFGTSSKISFGGHDGKP